MDIYRKKTEDDEKKGIRTLATGNIPIGNMRKKNEEKKRRFFFILPSNIGLLVTVEPLGDYASLKYIRRV